MVKEITVHELKYLIDTNEDIQLIDVREEFEHIEANIGGKLLPLKLIYFHIDKIDKNKRVVIYCRSGRRSAEAIKLIESVTDFKNLYNLKGGIVAWYDEIDSTIPIN